MFWNYVKFISLFSILIFIAVAIVGVFGLLIQKVVVYALVAFFLFIIFSIAWDACTAEYIMENNHE